MSYLSPNPILIKDSVISLKASSNHKKYRKSLKSQILNTSLFLGKNQQSRKSTLPNIIIPDRKVKRGQTVLIKSNTLPFIKGNDNESDLKTQIYQLEPQTSDKLHLSINDSSISMEKLLEISVKKIKLQALLRPKQKKNPADKVRIEITSCDDVAERKGRVTTAIQGNFLYPPMRSPSGSAQTKVSSRQTLSPMISRHSSICENKDHNDDPFFYTNILKNLNFSSFNCILEGLFEPYNSPFPYFTRIMKQISKIKPTEKPYHYKLPKAYYECKCISKSQITHKSPKNPQVKMAKVPSYEEFSKQIPTLKCIKFSMQTVKYESHIIILNFEGVLGSYISEICIKPGTLKNIKKLGKFFRIVLVLQTPEDKTKVILSIFQNLNIFLSAVYYRLNSFQNFELSKLQDYSQIYNDFNIENPEKQVVVIASHKYMENVKDNPLDVISSKVGLSHKLRIERSPFPCEKYKQIPITILIPNYQIKYCTSILKKFIKQLGLGEKNDGNKEDLMFRKIFESPDFIVVRSSVVHEIVLDFFRVNNEEKVIKGKNKIKEDTGFCRLHEKGLVRYSDTLYENMFVIN